MATVKIHYDKNVREMQKYLIEKREREDLTTEQSCSLESLKEEFTGLQNLYQSRGNNSIHLIQSWSPKESKTLTPEKIHEMGLEMANRFAPGHQFVVQTHTDEPHYHNHILINPVSIETGKRIHNKLGHIETLRNINDEIARERGLSVLPPQEKLRRPGPNEHVQRINQFRGRSYIVDMVNKADFARHHATNYDEYVSLLNAFDINVRIEPKNIVYFYPGREHGKRGARLGAALDKPGLETKFQANLERQQRSPELKATLSDLIAGYRSGVGATKAPDESSPKVPALVSSRAALVTLPRAEELAKSLVPIEEINKAKTHDILKYCEREKIDLIRDKEGRMRVAGRDYVEVSEYHWVNHKNKTRGNAIDFVAHHRQTGYLNAVAILNNNPRLLLLEQHLGELKKPYQSFHIPKGDEMPRKEALVRLARFLNHPVEHPVHSELFKRQGAHVTSSGSVLLYPEKDQTGYLEYEPDTNGRYSDTHGRYRMKRHGEINTPFFERQSRSADLHVFPDAKAFLRRYPDIYLARAKGASILALLEPSLPQVHKAVTQQSIKRVHIVCDPVNAKDANLVQFKERLARSLNPFSIDVSMAWEPVLEPARTDRDLVASRDLGREIAFHPLPGERGGR